MPFAFIIIGVMFVVAGVRNQSTQLVTLLKGDVTGSPNFIYWIVSILVIGAIGYVDSLRPVSRAFLALIIIVLVLKDGNKNNPGGGFIAQFNSAISKA